MDCAMGSITAWLDNITVHENWLDRRLFPLDLWNTLTLFYMESMNQNKRVIVNVNMSVDGF